MVLHRHGKRLYDGLIEVTKEHLQTVSEQIKKKTDPNLFAKHLELKWNEHAKSMSMIRDILMYMDRIYCPPNGLESVYDLGLSLWRDCVLRDSGINQRMINFLLDTIDAERKGERVDTNLAKDVVHMTSDVGEDVYVSDLETHILKKTGEFYANESETLLASCDCYEYLQMAALRLAEESTRVRAYLRNRTESYLVRKCESELLEKPAEVLLGLPNSGLKSMLSNSRSDQAALVYTLYKRLNGGLQFVKRTFSSYALDTGTKLVSDAELKNDPVAFVDALLKLKQNLDKTVVESFANDRTFQNALHAAFEKFVNLNNRSSEFISLYMDHKLRKGLKGCSDDEVEDVLNGAMSLFRFLSEKDVFEKYYKIHLSKRLLFNRSSSDDAEKLFVVKLKTECGYQYTSKIEGMMNDVRVSKDGMRLFRKHLANVERRNRAVDSGGDRQMSDIADINDTTTQATNHTTHSAGESVMDTGSSAYQKRVSNANLHGVDLNVTVLTTGSWPVVSAAQSVLPQVLQQNCDAYSSHYLSNHTGRKLSWLTSMGTAELRGVFGNGVKRDFVVSTHQMVVLLLFNDAECLSYSEIKQATGIEAYDLKRSLQSLSLVKGRNVLRKDPLTKEVNDADQFTFNSQFTSKLLKVKIGTVQATVKETDAEQKNTRVVIENDRKPQIEAAIVRVMKSRKVLDNNGVITEVTKQLSNRFTPTPSDIKKHLENLIEREFIERDRNDRKLFVYLA